MQFTKKTTVHKGFRVTLVLYELKSVKVTYTDISKMVSVRTYIRRGLQV